MSYGLLELLQSLGFHLPLVRKLSYASQEAPRLFLVNSLSERFHVAAQLILILLDQAEDQVIGFLHPEPFGICDQHFSQNHKVVIVA